jgi:predicted transcriptional regulator
MSSRIKDFTKESVSTYFVMVKNKATSMQPLTDIKVSGSGSRKIYQLLKKFVNEVHGIDVVTAEELHVKSALGHYELDDQLIELKRSQPPSGKLVTLAHEIGHVLTFNAKCKDSTNEILAESFACIILSALGMEVKDYSYFNQFKNCDLILLKYESRVKDAVLDFLSWVKENHVN